MFAIGQKTRCVLPRFTCASRIVRSSTHRPTDQLVQTSSSSSKEIEGQKANASALWATSETNRLIEHLAARIKAAGPISVADFMREALTNPRFGFYGRHEQFGRKEDLLVTPIIRQIYGEFLGKWLMKEHELVGTAQMQLVDMGPGRGTFVKHIAHLLKEHKYRPMHTFFALYEPNRLMRRRQAETLLGRSFDPLVANDYRLPESNYSLVWIDQLKQLLPGPTFFIVHEYLNAFPIHKFHKTKNGWKEVMIDWNPLNKQLQYVLAYKQTPMMRLYENFLNGIKNRQHVELSPQRAATIQSICKYIALNHGAALIADYAHWAEKSDTFRAFREENLVDPLSDPGNIDILSDVDFEELATRGDQIPHLQFFGPVSQGNFLYNIGLNDRLDDLLRGKTPEEQEAILDDVEKLVSSEALGERVLYMCVQRATRNNAPAGFSSPH